MNIYFSGIGGTGLGPLAELALGAGYAVAGSDQAEGSMTRHLANLGVMTSTDQSGKFLEQIQASDQIDLLVYTSSLPADHPELATAARLGITSVKRDELINRIISEHDLKLIAIAGTHGKTTTTAMTIWTLRQLGLPVSYAVGSSLPFAPAGHFDPGAEYFVYECDEFDRNFLHFSPYLSLITAIDYDHPDSYPTESEYRQAFAQFLQQSDHAILWRHDIDYQFPRLPASFWQLEDSDVLDIALPGAHNRANATLVAKACQYLNIGDSAKVGASLAQFPGSGRRFEKLADGLYSDYGHHPREIAATLQMASELSDHLVLVYQPHQNIRQHRVRDQYIDCMELAEQIYWLPTYLTREDPALETLTPEQLSSKLVNRDAVTYAELDDQLWQSIDRARAEGKLVLAMGAGTIDGWVRSRLSSHD